MSNQFTLEDTFQSGEHIFHIFKSKDKLYIEINQIYKAFQNQGSQKVKNILMRTYENESLTKKHPSYSEIKLITGCKAGSGIISMIQTKNLYTLFDKVDNRELLLKLIERIKHIQTTSAVTQPASENEIINYLKDSLQQTNQLFFILSKKRERDMQLLQQLEKKIKL